MVGSGRLRHDLSRDVVWAQAARCKPVHSVECRVAACLKVMKGLM